LVHGARQRQLQNKVTLITSIFNKSSKKRIKNTLAN